VEYKEQDSKSGNKNKKGEDERGKEQSTRTKTKFAMSMQDRDPTISFHPDGKDIRLQSRDKTRWAGCRCSAGIPATLKDNKDGLGYSFECEILDKDGIVRVGWSSEDASLQLGTDRDGFGYGGTGMKANNGKYEPFPSKDKKVQFSVGDVVGCHLKIIPPPKTTSGDKKKQLKATVSFSKNGEFVGQAFEVSSNIANQKLSFYPTICMKNAECVLNFGDEKPLRFPLPEGYQPLATAANSEDHVVANPRDVLSFQLQQQRNSQKKGPLAIVIEPTRDLAEQR
jgi:ATP-dependent RNA helicase DDX1